MRYLLLALIAVAALFLGGCKTMSVLGDEVAGALPATQSDVDDLRTHVDAQDAQLRADADAADAKIRGDALAADQAAKGAIQAAAAAGKDAAAAVLEGYEAAIRRAGEDARDAKDIAVAKGTLAGQAAEEARQAAEESRKARESAGGLAGTLVTLIDALQTTGLVGGPILALLLALRTFLTRRRIKKVVEAKDAEPFIGPGGAPMTEEQLVRAAAMVYAASVPPAPGGTTTVP